MTMMEVFSAQRLPELSPTTPGNASHTSDSSRMAGTGSWTLMIRLGPRQAWWARMTTVHTLQFTMKSAHRPSGSGLNCVITTSAAEKHCAKN